MKNIVATHFQLSGYVLLEIFIHSYIYLFIQVLLTIYYVPDILKSWRWKYWQRHVLVIFATLPDARFAFLLLVLYHKAWSLWILLMGSFELMPMGCTGREGKVRVLFVQPPLCQVGLCAKFHSWRTDLSQEVLPFLGSETCSFFGYLWIKGVNETAVTRPMILHYSSCVP